MGEGVGVAATVGVGVGKASVVSEVSGESVSEDATLLESDAAAADEEAAVIVTESELFKTLQDVTRQRASQAAHIPILDFSLFIP